MVDRLTLNLHVKIPSGHSMSGPSNSCNKIVQSSYSIMTFKDLVEVSLLIGPKNRQLK